jgi:cytochrome c peroxidase
MFIGLNKNKMEKTYSVLVLLIGVFIVSSCNEDTLVKEEVNNNYAIISQYLNLPETPYSYTPIPPAHAGQFRGDPGDKFLHPEQLKLRNYKARTGRVLFYDTRLSHNNTTSCATCHNPENAFADNLKTSLGFDGQSGRRNSLALGNTVGFEFAYGSGQSSASAAFSWDDSVESLQDQIKNAITSEVEMGLTMDEVVRRVREEEFYQVLFEEAGPIRAIDEEFILEALEAFVNGIIATDSKFDREMNAMINPDPFSDFPGYTEEENLGKKLFNSNCSSCHGTSHTGVVVAASNNGLELNYEDGGKGEKTNQSEDIGIFKVPFLRNVTLTAPYMHDGRFSTLEEVIDHYSTGIANHPNLGRQLRRHEGPKKFDFSSTEKKALIAYLHTLTDIEMTQKDKYSNPFK